MLCFWNNIEFLLLLLFPPRYLFLTILFLFFCLFQPQFITLAHLWTGFQDEMVLLSVLSNILASLEPFAKVCIIYDLSSDFQRTP